ncbi:hypothetical protein JIN84_03130 [Luteolibacter yonseiensis]|uniref:Uncharacterized protein n=1 Tax=Luteolibacter yonseiensis TaxID=1144680 RepID=A0A934R1G7_9BACT|nr:hypothetical protein [Luteolibacter yonseiensis]MBK1814591.1 hypothetical protein [Luteolibacter yonseiensis]
MKPSRRDLAVFGLTCLATAAAWIHFRPIEAPAAPAPAPPVTTPTGWSGERLDQALAAVGKAGSAAARLDACKDLLQIPPTDILATLEQQVAESDRQLSLVAKTLLIRWAAEDGEAAARWAWNRLRSKEAWEEAFRQIGPAWAAHNPTGLGRWAMTIDAKGTPPDDAPEAGTMEMRVASRGLHTDISRWLVTEDPRLAYEILIKHGRMSSEDPKIALALSSVERVREAVSAFGDFKIGNPVRLTGKEIHLYYLFLRWSELDPDDFNRSRHAGTIAIGDTEKAAAALERFKSLPAREKPDAAENLMAGIVPAARSGRMRSIAQTWADTDPSAAIRWLDARPPEDRPAANTARASAIAPHDLTVTLDWMDGLPEEQRLSLVQIFDSWTKAHPGQRADRSGWPAGRVEAWEDLEALQVE